MSKDNIAIDDKGRPLPFSSEEVEAIVQRAAREGKLLAAIVQMPSGHLAVQVFGEPSEELAGALEQTAFAYRKALRGH